MAKATYRIRSLRGLTAPKGDAVIVADSGAQDEAVALLSLYPRKAFPTLPRKNV